MRRKERWIRGSLTDEQVREIRGEPGVPARRLAARYGVSRSLVVLIRQGRRRAGVTDPSVTVTHNP